MGHKGRTLGISGEQHGWLINFWVTLFTTCKCYPELSRAVCGDYFDAFVYAFVFPGECLFPLFF